MFDEAKDTLKMVVGGMTGAGVSNVIGDPPIEQFITLLLLVVAVFILVLIIERAVPEPGDQKID